MAAKSDKYYWLKLKDDFFSSKRIKKLRRLAGGDTYVIIYLKMQLIAMKRDGIIQYTGLEKTFAEELALDIDEDAENVQVTLSYLINTGLAETSDDLTYFFPYAVENVGSETAAAQRMREARNKVSLPPHEQSANNVEQCSNNVQNCYTEIEKEIDRDKEIEIEIEKEVLTEPVGSVCRTKDVRRVVEEWNKLGLQQVQKVTADSKRGGMLRARVNEYGVDKVIEAIGKIRESDFLKGQNDNGWVITFEWFVKPNNFVKILEGNYDNRTSSKRPRSRYYTTAEEYERPTKIDTEKLAMLEKNMKRSKKTE